MIKNNLIYGFNENGVIGYTKNAIGDMSVLVHEYAHTYFNEHKAEISSLKVDGLFTKEEYAKEFRENVRFEHLFDDYDDYKENKSSKYLYADEELDKMRIEHFATAIGVNFKKIQDKLPTYESAERMRKNLAKDVESICSEELKEKEGYSIFIDVLKSMCGKQKKQVEQKKTISMKDILKKAKSYSELPAEQDAFVQGAKWAMEQVGVKVVDDMEKVATKESTNEGKTKNPNGDVVPSPDPNNYYDTMRYVFNLLVKEYGQEGKEIFEGYLKTYDLTIDSIIPPNILDDLFGSELYPSQVQKLQKLQKLQKQKKTTKKAKKEVEEKPQFEVGDEFDNGWLIVEYLGKKKYRLVDDEGNVFEKTETEIEEA